jgi:hypothetical protein
MMMICRFEDYRRRCHRVREEFAWCNHSDHVLAVRFRAHGSANLHGRANAKVHQAMGRHMGQLQPQALARFLQQQQWVSFFFSINHRRRQYLSANHFVLPPFLALIQQIGITVPMSHSIHLSVAIRPVLGNYLQSSHAALSLEYIHKQFFSIYPQ